MARFGVISLLSFFLLACGQKGSLTLPQSQQPADTIEAPASATQQQ
ncbi:lipoprotein [Saccharophagus sp. K07]